MKVTNSHVYFWRGIYSNWHPANFTDPEACLKFANTEQGFMWYKARFFGNNDIAEFIAKETNPQKCKKFGRAIRNFNNEKWSIIRMKPMIHVNYLKFSQNKELKQELLNTGDRILVEASPYDKIWGVGLREEDELILDEKNWKGLNLLGKALMEVRKLLNV